MLSSLQQQLTSFWQHQTNSRKITLVAAILAILILVIVFLTWASTPSYTVAFSGLSEDDAGQIVQKMTDEGIPYKLENSSTILVPSDKVYDVRLSMARQGLPKSGTVGFELFSGNTLGMTEFTQRVNYQRALEGELERTIMSLSSVSAVRVHIVTPEKTILTSNQAPTTASVTVEEKPDKHLDSSQVQSITHLVASSVENLRPENVVVVDTNGNMLASGNASGDSEESLGQSDSRRAAELAAAADVQKKTQNLLDSVLGPNKSVVQASVSMDWTSKKTTTESFKPDPTAVRSSQKVNETYTTAGGIVGGIPGAASNLPTPVPTTTSATGDLVYQRSEETINYEMSKTQIDSVENPGQIKKVSLSVMVDGVNDPTQLASLKTAVAAAAGIDETRGDVLAVESLAFDHTYYQTQNDEMKKEQQNDLYLKIGIGVGLGLVLIGLLWYVSQLFKNLRLASGEAWTPILKPVGEMALPGSMAVGQMSGSLPMGRADQPAGLPSNEQYIPEIPAHLQANAPTAEDEQMTKVISRLAEENPANVAEIIQLWLSEDGK